MKSETCSASNRLHVGRRFDTGRLAWDSQAQVYECIAPGNCRSETYSSGPAGIDREEISTIAKEGAAA